MRRVKNSTVAQKNWTKKTNRLSNNNCQKNTSFVTGTTKDPATATTILGTAIRAHHILQNTYTTPSKYIYYDLYVQCMLVLFSPSSAECKDHNLTKPLPMPSVYGASFLASCEFPTLSLLLMVSLLEVSLLCSDYFTPVGGCRPSASRHASDRHGFCR